MSFDPFGPISFLAYEQTMEKKNKKETPAPAKGASAVGWAVVGVFILIAVVFALVK